MKKINIKWVAFGIFVAALIGLGTFLIIRECNYNNKTECDVDKVEVIKIGPDTTVEFDTINQTLDVMVEQFEEVVDSIEETI